MELPNFADPIWFINTTLAFLAVLVGRYFLFTGVFYAFFYRLSYSKWKARKLNARNYYPQQFKREVIWSMVTSTLFAVAGTLTIILWQKGYTKIYTNINDYGWWYLPVSLLLFMLFHETYYYWLHRWMHHPKIFKIVHKVHHDSNITSPFTAFSFHPLEGLLQAVFLPVMLVFLPMHYYIIIVVLTIMTISSVVNHLDIEIYPKHFHEHFIGKWLIGATHHSLHHKQFKYNYGLYFTFWDKIKKTESPLFKNLFEKITEGV
jgi:sterol desaturase/sphingolipid hydroxylase (fatty acid hydroxylase superfamily)